MAVVNEWKLVEAPRLAPRTSAARLADVLDYYQGGHLTAAEAMEVLALPASQNESPRFMRLTNSRVVRAWRRLKIWLRERLA